MKRQSRCRKQTGWKLNKGLWLKNNEGAGKCLTQEINLKVTAVEYGNSPVVFSELCFCYQVVSCMVGLFCHCSGARKTLLGMWTEADERNTKLCMARGWKAKRLRHHWEPSTQYCKILIPSAHTESKFSRANLTITKSCNVNPNTAVKFNTAPGSPEWGASTMIEHQCPRIFVTMAHLLNNRWILDSLAYQQSQLSLWC